MIKTRSLLAMLLGVAMISTSLTGFVSAEETAEPAAGEQAAAENGETPLVVGYSPFNSKFSPFFSETAYDQDVWTLTSVNLLNSDRMGAIIYKGIEGETIEYNGTDYTYYGPADCEVTENEDGTVYYDFTMRDDLVFSDGVPATIDDVIFSMYVYCDPTYDGSTTLFSMPIEGLAEYRSGVDTLFNLLIAAGEDNDDFTFWDEETQTAFWADFNQAAEAFAQEIVDYCKAAGYNAEDDSVAACAANWGFELAEDATVRDFWDTMAESYNGDIAALVSTETAGSSMADLMEDYEAYTVGIETGESAPNITGIQKTGDYSMRVVAEKVDATLIYQLTLPVSPLHYYGDAEQYDYDNNQFGFPKGDLSMIRAKTTQPMGMGPYKFVTFEDGVVYFEANESYYLGAPKTRYVNFRQFQQDTDKLNGVVTGTIDITDPSFDTDTVDAIEQANGGELTGDVISTDTVDNLGYGYIGINTHNVKVGDDPGSEESKNLRRAFATIFSVYRDVAIDSYYGERASVINYPISNTSWAAPQPTDDDYEIAFSVDVNGDPIYTSDMSADDRYAAAAQAALGFFEAAGYTVEDGKVTAAPEGASLEYEVLIPADGAGDHPAFMILTLAHDALAELGINLIITDLTNSSDLWTGLEAGQVAMWCAAWGATVDPDMYQIYYSGIESGEEPGGSNYMYKIEDPELDEMIMAARESTDQEYRKLMYKACLDTIISWACEIPTYQRQNAIIFSTERVNMDTVTPDITTFYVWLKEIENIELN